MVTNRRLRIPERQYASLARIQQLSLDQFTELLSVLRETPATLWKQDYLSRVEATVRQTPVTDTQAIMDVLLTLYVVRSDFGMSAPEFATAVRQTAEAAGSEKLPFSTADWQLFQDRLEKLLELDQTIGVVSKAGYLAAQHENTLHSAEIFTDLRPVFGVNPAEWPSGVIIEHKLKVTYHRGNELKEFYIVFTPENVAAFRALLDRVDAKEKSLRTLLASTSVPVLSKEA